MKQNDRVKISDAAEFHAGYIGYFYGVCDDDLTLAVIAYNPIVYDEQGELSNLFFYSDIKEVESYDDNSSLCS